MKSYLAVDKNGEEFIYNALPNRQGDRFYNQKSHGEYHSVELPKGSIEKLLGRKLTWKDEPQMIE